MNNIYNDHFAKFYEQLYGNQNFDLDFYKHFIKDDNALEIGSGTGRLLIPLIQQGFKVEGIEPSKDMIEICKQKAQTLNLEPIIYQQNLQDLNLPKIYKTIFLPLYVFQHIIDKNDAINALKKVFKYLKKDGQILISIFVPSEWHDTQDWQIRTQNIQHDEKLILYEKVEFDKFNQIQAKNLKFELYKNNKLIDTFFSSIKFKIYSRFELQSILEDVGFKNIQIYGDYTFGEANKESTDFIFVGSPNFS